MQRQSSGRASPSEAPKFRLVKKGRPTEERKYTVLRRNLHSHQYPYNALCPRNDETVEVVRFGVPIDIYVPVDALDYKHPKRPEIMAFNGKHDGTMYTVSELLSLTQVPPIEMDGWYDNVAVRDMEIKVVWKGYEEWSRHQAPIKTGLPSCATRAHVAEATAKILDGFITIARENDASMFTPMSAEDQKYRIGTALGPNQVYVFGLEKIYGNVFQPLIAIEREEI